jgi:hypothetical protein
MEAPTDPAPTKAFTINNTGRDARGGNGGDGGDDRGAEVDLGHADIYFAGATTALMASS